MQKETLELLEERIVQNLNDFELHGVGSEGRNALTKETCELVEKLNESERINLDAWDKEDRRELEREKNRNAVAIEQAKQDVTWQRALLEILKVMGPIVGGGIFYGIFQHKVLKFEETGRVNSTMGRDLNRHLPKFTK